MVRKKTSALPSRAFVDDGPDLATEVPTKFRRAPYVILRYSVPASDYFDYPFFGDSRRRKIQELSEI